MLVLISCNKRIDISIVDKTTNSIVVAPSNLISNNIKSNEVYLVWNDNSTNEDGFKIEKKDQNGNFILLATLNMNITTYKDTNLLPLTNYTYRVYAYNNRGNSGYSNELSIKTLIDPIYSSLSNGLLVNYPFSGNAIDNSGNNRNGNVFGATLFNDRFNKVNSCYSFNGVNNKIIIPLQQNSLKSYSVSVWFKTTIGGQLISGRGIKDEPGINAFIHNAYTGGSNVGKAKFVVSAPGTSVGKISNYTYLDDNWHHFVGNYFGVSNNVNSNEFSIYIDNVLVSQSNTNTGSATLPINNNSDIMIGSSWTDASPFFKGLIDDVRIYNRVLTLDEINYLFKY